MLLGFHSMLRVEGSHLLASEVGPASEEIVDSDCRSLIDDDNSLPVALTHHLLGIGIVGGAEGIGSLPFHDRDIPGIHCQVDPAAIGEGILMLAVTLEVEFAAIDQETVANHLDRADSIRKFIDIFSIADPDSVEIGIQRPPEPGLLKGKLTGQAI